MSLTSTLGIGDGGGAGEAWGAKMMGAEEAKDGLEETTGEVWSQVFSGELSHEYDGNVMSMGRGRIQGSWIRWSAACSLRSPWKSASLSTRGLVGW